MPQTETLAQKFKDPLFMMIQELNEEDERKEQIRQIRKKSIKEYFDEVLMKYK